MGESQETRTLYRYGTSYDVPVEQCDAAWHVVDEWLDAIQGQPTPFVTHEQQTVLMELIAIALHHAAPQSPAGERADG